MLSPTFFRTPPSQAYKIQNQIIRGLGNKELDKIINLNNPIVIMGDINVNNLTNNKEKQIFAEALEGYNLRRLELAPTRVTYHSSTSIDFICMNLNEDHIAYNGTL
ncbi:hypothetical protein J6590_012365 [Homalodisca vitripennis]|nr:hypothetical protein J6590_012365 [Homalodisca vitripennis]